MSIANTMFYKNRMQCGLPRQGLFGSPLLLYQPRMLACIPAPIISSSTVDPSTSSTTNIRSDWLYLALDPTQRVLFLNTDNIEALQSKADNITNNEGIDKEGKKKEPQRSIRTSNQYEADIILLITQSLDACCVAVNKNTDNKTNHVEQSNNNEIGIGIIAPYRAQVRTISETLATGVVVGGSTAGTDNRDISITAPSIQMRTKVEVSTVDKFQGRDMNVVIVSTSVHGSSPKDIPTAAVGDVTTGAAVDVDTTAAKATAVVRIVMIFILFLTIRLVSLNS
jgi:AAA domain